MGDKLRYKSRIFYMFILDRIERELQSLKRLELKFGLSWQFSEFFDTVRILFDVLFRVFRFSKASFKGDVWWPRTAIRNFLDNSRKFNFCNRLILKLLHFFSIKKILKMYFLFFKDNLFLKRLNSFDFWKYYKLFLKR